MEHEELVLLPRNLKLEVTEYSRQIYGPGGYAQGPGDEDDDDDLEAISRTQPRKRNYGGDPCR